MERLLALALVAIALAGCTAPEAQPSAAREELPFLDPASLPPEPASAAGSAERPEAETASAAPNATATAPLPPPGPAAPPTEVSAPPANASAPPPEPAPPTGPPRADVPTLKAGDRWVFRGVNRTGAAFEEDRVVVGPGTLAGMATYLLDVKASEGTQRVHATQAGLNPVNDTGSVTELLRFPLTAGANWTFGWAQDGSWSVENGTRNYSGTWLHWLGANVTVLAYEKVSTVGGRFDSWHVQANITTGLGKLTRWVLMDYWYAPSAKTLVKFESIQQDSAHKTWSELVQAKV